MPAPAASTSPALHERIRDAIALAWGFAEGTLFFVVPDVFITYSAAHSPRRGFRHVWLAILGAVLAGVVMFAWSATAPTAAHSAVAHVPFVEPAMFERVAHDYQRAGAWAPWFGPWSMIPFKIYAILAPERVPLVQFALVSIVARGTRFLLSWGVAAAIGSIARRWSAHPRRWILAIFALHWIAIYVYVWGFATTPA